MTDAVTQAASVAAKGGARSQLRWLVLGLCAATMFTEGYDAQFMGSVLPGPQGIGAAFGMTPVALWPAISADLVGLALGAFFIAPLADNFGGRRLVIYSVFAFGVLTIASVVSQSLIEIMVFHCLTGLGLGGAMANT